MANMTGVMKHEIKPAGMSDFLHCADLWSLFYNKGHGPENMIVIYVFTVAFMAMKG